MTINRNGTVLDVPFRGERNYLQGAEILNAMHTIIGAHPNEFSFSVHEMIKSNRIEVLQVDTASELGRLPVRLQFTEGGLWGAKPAQPKETSERLSNYENEVWTRSRPTEFGNVIEEFSRLHPLALAVSLKKQMMIVRLGQDFGKWLFCKLQATRPPPGTAKKVSIRYLRGNRNIHVSLIEFDDLEYGEMTFVALQ